ncbi:MAG: hypothetical protein CM15mP120_24210 [Pseudomonadota bacterium]|nr:MAG: hypothetical protein CM15mP120_24210 [Pseudomonadota bacterium]
MVLIQAAQKYPAVRCARGGHRRNTAQLPPLSLTAFRCREASSEGADFAALEQAAMLFWVAEMSGGLAGVLHVILTISQRVNNLINTLAVTNR